MNPLDVLFDAALRAVDNRDWERAAKLLLVVLYHRMPASAVGADR